MKFSEDKLNLKYGVDNTRTIQRLDLIESLGLKLVGLGDFGIPHVTSGLYIEKVWNDSDETFNGYIEWLKIEFLDKITEKTIDDKTYKVLQNPSSLWFDQRVIYEDKVRYVSRIEEKYIVLDFTTSANPTEIFKIIEEI